MNWSNAVATWNQYTWNIGLWSKCINWLKDRNNEWTSFLKCVFQSLFGFPLGGFDKICQLARKLYGLYIVCSFKIKSTHNCAIFIWNPHFHSSHAFSSISTLWLKRYSQLSTSQHPVSHHQTRSLFIKMHKLFNKIAINCTFFRDCLSVWFDYELVCESSRRDESRRKSGTVKPIIISVLI